MIKIRPYRPEDFNFVANSYLKSYRGSPEAKHKINDIYYPEHKERLAKMLTGTVLVACSTEDDDHILGYVAASAGKWNILHYVYVKFPARQWGIGRKLVEAALPDFGTKMTLCTHTCRNWTEMSGKYQLIYDTREAK